MAGRQEGKQPGRRWWFVSTGIFALSLTAYGAFASQTRLLNAERAARAELLQSVASRPDIDTDRLRVAAAAYWDRYPDVAGDPFYGRSGPLGDRGAHQHFLDHGRRDGRQWE